MNLHRQYDQLHRLAQRVRRVRASDTMSTTALVHEDYIKFAFAESLTPEGRLHFFRIAARALHQDLVGAAPSDSAGGGQG